MCIKSSRMIRKSDRRVILLSIQFKRVVEFNLTINYKIQWYLFKKKKKNIFNAGTDTSFPNWIIDNIDFLSFFSLFLLKCLIIEWKKRWRKSNDIHKKLSNVTLCCCNILYHIYTCGIISSGMSFFFFSIYRSKYCEWYLQCIICIRLVRLIRN